MNILNARLFKKSRMFEVSISDHHHLIPTSMRSQYTQGNPKIKFYQCYKSYNFEYFNNELSKLVKPKKGIKRSSLNISLLQIFNAYASI